MRPIDLGARGDRRAPAFRSYPSPSLYLIDTVELSTGRQRNPRSLSASGECPAREVTNETGRWWPVLISGIGRTMVVSVPRLPLHGLSIGQSNIAHQPAHSPTRLATRCGGFEPGRYIREGDSAFPLVSMVARSGFPEPATIQSPCVFPLLLPGKGFRFGPVVTALYSVLRFGGSPN